MNARSAEPHLGVGPAPEDAHTWDVDIPLITNPLVRRQLLLVAGGAGLVMALLMSFIFATTGEADAIPMMWLISLLTAAGLGLLLLVVALLVFGNRIRVRFTLDDTGVGWETIDQRARAGSRLALIAGILGGSPQTAGAGALGIARETDYVRWDEISSAQLYPRHRIIVLRGSWRPMMMVVCPPETYNQIVAAANARITPPSPATSPAGAARWWRKPLVRALYDTVIVALAAAPTFILATTVLDLDLLLPIILLTFALATVWLIPLFGWVVIACAAILAVQITWLGIAEFGYLYGAELVAFFLAYLGLILLTWRAWRALHSKLVPPLISP